MQQFTQLQVWQQGHALVLNVYRMTTGFPRTESCLRWLSTFNYKLSTFFQELHGNGKAN